MIQRNKFSEFLTKERTLSIAGFIEIKGSLFSMMFVSFVVAILTLLARQITLDILGG